MDWFVYVLWSQRLGRSYVGIAVDPARRLRQHNGELVRGARSTRAGRPWELKVVYGPFEDRSTAQVAEHTVKLRTGSQRWAADSLPYDVVGGSVSPG